MGQKSYSHYTVSVANAPFSLTALPYNIFHPTQSNDKTSFQRNTFSITFGNDIALNLTNLTHKIIAKNLSFVSELFFSNTYTEWQHSFSSVMTLSAQGTVNVDKL